MAGWLAEPVFSIGAAQYDWADVLLAAHLCEDWAALENQIRQGLACQQALDEDDESGGVDPQAVDAAAAEFRYARDLISADEAEAWLAARGMTSEAWLEYIERGVLRAQRAEELHELVDRYPVTDDEIAALTWVEGMCSGLLATFARNLAARAVVGDAPNPGGLVSSQADTPSRRDRCPSRIVQRYLPGLSREFQRERLDRLVSLERAFQRAHSATPSQDLVRRQLANHWIEWVRVKARHVVLADEQAAREIVLSIREDGLGLDEVAAAARVEVHKTDASIDTLPSEVRDPLLAAGLGVVLGPLALAGGFAVFVVDDKVMPSLETPDVLAQATTAILDGWIERAIIDRVRWHAPF